jgi:polyhydroxyalkanoate synthesis regulator phasin
MIQNLKRSARTIWNAHRAAFETTRHEAGKVFGLAIHEGQKFSSRGRDAADAVVGDLAGAADESLSIIEQSLQQGVSRVIRRIGLPTAKDVNSLSRRVDALTARVEVRAAKKSKRRATRRAA